MLEARAAAARIRERNDTSRMHVGTAMPHLLVRPRRERTAQEIAEFEERRERRARHEAAVAAFLDSGVPPIHRAARLDNLDGVREPDREAYALAVEKLRAKLDGRHDAETGRKQPMIVVLTGRRGPGKSYMAAAVAIDNCRRARTSRFVDLETLLLELRATFDGDGKKLAVERRYVLPDLLVIDQAEMSKRTDFADRELQRLLWRRYEQLGATVITTNEKPEVVRARLGPSIVDRMHECGGGFIECPWASLRRRPAAPAGAGGE